MTFSFSSAAVRAGDAGPYAALVLEGVIPARIADLIGEPPLTRLEDLSIYLRLLAAFIETLAPGDIAEWTWTKFIVDLVWERRRLQRAKVLLLEQIQRNLAMNLLADPAVLREARLTVAERTDLASGVAAAKPQAIATFQAHLARLGKDVSDVGDSAAYVSIDQLAPVNALILLCEQRLDETLKTLLKWRARFHTRAAAALADASLAANATGEPGHFDIL
ncbi:MAG: hypothetical protein WC068_10495 [Caulobacter sp.]